MAGRGEDTTKLSAEERQAVKDRARELRAAKKGAAAEQAVLEAIAAMSEDDQVIAKRVHAIVKEVAPELGPKTMYGMPAYARDGKTVILFQAASKFDTRYSTLSFEDRANLDDGPMWPTGFAITELTPDVEDRIVDLVRRAVT
ncbi:iron chaperone [Ornithinimicrobium murale]|uniref:iron chaperone n=1 Tax=Ornithinimicrobium murale TaxID=1050153 RepID=UPI000E0D1118|nr:DUF1801 domain-containing protein [Ornithinimicrobium murale]